MKLVRDAETILRLQDYSPKDMLDVKWASLSRFTEHGGSLTEISRFDPGGIHQPFNGFKIAQLTYSTLDPGVIKAFHLHKRQTDIWFVPPEDRLLVVLVDLREDSKAKKTGLKIVLGDGKSFLLKIPPGVAHGCKNIGDTTAHIIYMTDVQFSPDPSLSDEGRLPWDLVGADIWEFAKD